MKNAALIYSLLVSWLSFNLHNDNSNETWSKQQISYIYNKSLDLLVKDERLSGLAGQMPFRDKDQLPVRIEKYFVNKQLDSALHPRNYLLLHPGKWNAENVHSNFSKINFIALQDVLLISESKFNKIETSSRNNDIALIKFSDIYKNQANYFITASIEYFISPDHFPYISTVIFEFQICESKMIMFRKSYTNIYYNNPYQLNTEVINFPEKGCQN